MGLKSNSGIVVGCCGFVHARHKYFARFPAVEIQQTFYQPPKIDTALRWREEAPPDFIFCVKAWQLITHPPSSPSYRRLGRAIPRAQFERYGHFRPTNEVAEAWKTTLDIARALEAEVILLQSPPGFQPNEENVDNLRRFLKRADRGNFAIAWEPRGKWLDKTVLELCRDFDLIHCVDPFIAPPTWGLKRYFRLHGIGGHRHRYSDDELRRLANMIPGKKTYVMFNNISMREDAGRFMELIEARTRDGA